jgi:hypothetical protein
MQVFGAMEATASRVAHMMLRRNSRKDFANLGTLFSQWSGRSTSDPMRRMTMGGAPPPVQVAEPTLDACTDAFCAVQLTPTNSITKQDSLLLSPRGSLKNLACLLLSPAASLQDGACLMSPQGSVGKGAQEGNIRPAFRAHADAEEAPVESKTSVQATTLPVC